MTLWACDNKVATQPSGFTNREAPRRRPRPSYIPINVAALCSGPVLLVLPFSSHTSTRIGPPSPFNLTASDPQQHERRKTQGTGPMIGSDRHRGLHDDHHDSLLPGMKYNSFCDPQIARTVVLV